MIYITSEVSMTVRCLAQRGRYAVAAWVVSDIFPDALNGDPTAMNDQNSHRCLV